MTVATPRAGEEAAFARAASSAARRAESLRAIRRRLHRTPEIGLELPVTQSIVLESLAALPGLEITTGAGCSSVTAVLRAPQDPSGVARPVVLLRGDMDALPVQELADLPYASEIPQAMHACGHDLHTTMLLGAAQILHDMRERLAADVVFMFQPGEEGHGGAAIMIDEGVLDAAGRRADAAFGLHVFSSGMPRGVFSSRSGTLMAAADTLQVTVHGEGGHGSTPHRAKDPIPAACAIVLALQTLATRETDIFDPVVLTVGEFHAGTASNVIPAQANFGLSVRTYSRSSRERTLRRIRQLIEGMATAHGMDVTIAGEDGYPVTTTTPSEHDFALGVLTDLFGADRAVTATNPLPGSEDFSFVLQEVPGAFLLLGASMPDQDPDTAPLNHSPYAQFDDDLLADGACALACLALAHPTRMREGRR